MDLIVMVVLDFSAFLLNIFTLSDDDVSNLCVIGIDMTVIVYVAINQIWIWIDSSKEKNVFYFNKT